MFRKGTHVVVVDEALAHKMNARVSKGDKGVILRTSTLSPLVMMDSACGGGWYIPTSCLRRIRKPKEKLSGWYSQPLNGRGLNGSSVA